MRRAGSGVRAGPTARLFMLVARVSVDEAAELAGPWERRVMSSAASVGEM